MANPILVDTDVMVDFLRGYPKAEALIKKHSTRVILSSIVATELYAGVRNDEELQALDRLMSLFRIVPVSLAHARTGGLHKSEFGKSHGIGLADVIIAATAEAESAALKTLNVRHYPMIKGLRPAYKKT